MYFVGCTHDPGGSIIRDYAAYLFDADGTLIDTTELICRCFAHTVKQFAGREVHPADVVPYIGLPLREQMVVHLGPLTDAEFAERSAVHMAYQYAIYPQFLRAFPGVREVLARLKDRQRRLAVVTSRRLESLTRFLEEVGIGGFFDALVTPESTERHKPHPDPARKALELLNVNPSDALMVGDSAYDIRCGAAAGVDTAFAAWGGGDPSAVLPRPTHILSSPGDVLME